MLYVNKFNTKNESKINESVSIGLFGGFADSKWRNTCISYMLKLEGAIKDSLKDKKELLVLDPYVSLGDEISVQTSISYDAKWLNCCDIISFYFCKGANSLTSFELGYIVGKIDKNKDRKLIISFDEEYERQDEVLAYLKSTLDDDEYQNIKLTAYATPTTHAISIFSYYNSLVNNTN